MNFVVSRDVMFWQIYFSTEEALSVSPINDRFVALSPMSSCRWWDGSHWTVPSSSWYFLSHLCHIVNVTMEVYLGCPSSTPSLSGSHSKPMFCIFVLWSQLDQSAYNVEDADKTLGLVWFGLGVVSLIQGPQVKVKVSWLVVSRDTFDTKETGPYRKSCYHWYVPTPEGTVELYPSPSLCSGSTWEPCITMFSHYDASPSATLL